MTVSDIVSIIALVFSVVAVFISFLSHRNSIRQTSIMSEELEQLKRPNSAANGTNLRLNHISDGIERIASILDKK